jgi:hypothetical protein
MKTFNFNLTKIDNKFRLSAKDEKLNVLDLFIAPNLRPVLNKGGGLKMYAREFRL